MSSWRLSDSFVAICGRDHKKRETHLPGERGESPDPVIFSDTTWAVVSLPKMQDVQYRLGGGRDYCIPATQGQHYSQ